MHTDRRKRAYYHETRDVCDGLPDLLHRFPLRALMVARAGDRVVLPAGHEPTELPLLNRLGFGPRPEDLIFVDDDGAITSGDTDLEGVEILPFSGVTTRGRAFAERYGAKFRAPPREACVAANSKAVFQKVAERLRERGEGMIAPRGIATDKASVQDAVSGMLASCARVIVKGVNSASGLQQIAVDRGQEIGAADLAALPDELVVQEWFRHDISPSLHCMLTPNGVTRTLYASRQLLDGRHHVGNIFNGPKDPEIPEWARERMHAIASSVSRAFSGTILGRSEDSLGYWGPLGVDFMIDVPGRKVLAAEVNARIAAPWYTWQAMRRRLGSALPFCARSYRLREGTSIGDLAAAMEPLLFHHRGLQGFVPFCFVPEHGFVYGATYVLSEADLPGLSSKVDAAMAELAP